MYLFSAGLFAKLTFRILIYPHFLSPLRHIPGPKSVSIWNGQFSIIHEQPSGQPYIKWMDEIPNDGLIRYLGFCNSERVVPTSPKVLHEAMYTKGYIFQKEPRVRRSVGRMFGMHGMLFSEGEQHKIQRKHVLPAFSYRHLRDLIPNFWEKSIELSKAIEDDLRTKQGTGTEKQTSVIIEISQWLGRATLDIIGSTGFGYEFNCINNNAESNTLAHAFGKVFQPASKALQLQRMIFQYLPEWMIKLIPSKRRKESLEAIEMVKGMCMRMVRVKKREYETGGKVGQKGIPDVRPLINETGLTRDIDILSLITKDSPFTEEEMRDQLMTFLAAGWGPPCQYFPRFLLTVYH